MNYTIRKATQGDLELSFEIRKKTMFKYVADSKGWDEEKELVDHIKDFNTEIMQIIEVDCKPIGVFESVIENGYLHVHGLYILEEFQNCKIGTNVMNNTIISANTKGIPVLLQVLKVNDKAKAFYEKIGFKVFKEAEHHFQMIYK